MNGIRGLYGVLFFLLTQSKPSEQFYRSRTGSNHGFQDEEAGPGSDRQDSYVVGVVEFRPELLNMEIRQRTELHIEAYEQLMRSDEAKPIDILVLSEFTLNTLSDPVFVPNPDDDMVPCQEDSPNVLSRLSCLAAETGKYIVINLSEIFNCTYLQEDDPRPCGPHGFHRYNTDVVFDRNGAVIARYRKFNLFREVGTNTTYLPEIVTFETDFGVTFGLFTCFDLLFARPPLELVKRGITDFLVPAMWTSEPPFLTAAQIYESWAYANDVNLIVSGTNYDPSGSTGTGVFNGRNGAVFSFMTGKPTRQLFPIRVPKITHDMRDATTHRALDSNDTVSGRLHGKLLENIRMGQDFLERFTTMQINPVRQHDQIGQIICNGDFCCDFSVQLSVIPDREYTHYYRFAVFDGVRTFQGFADAHVSICGIITCRNSSLTSCGLPMHENSNYIEFREIVIAGRFIANGTLAMPNSLDDMFHSLDASRYQFYSTVDYVSNQQNVQLTLSSTVANLQTFAIYAFNHKDFKFFNPINPPEEPTTQEPSTQDDYEDGGSSSKTISALLIALLLVSMVLQL